MIVEVDRITDDAKCEMLYWSFNGQPDKKILMAWGDANLMSSRMYGDHIKMLSTRMTPDIDWQTILTAVSRLTVQHLRESSHEENINLAPASMKVDYLLDPIFPIGEPTTIYTAGGKGKSIFADYFCVLIQFGICAEGGLPFTPKPANVLYLDWEADSEIHRRYIQAIKKGLRIDDPEEIGYIHLDYPLAQVIDNVRRIVDKRKVEFVVIDSQMAATASGTRGMTEAQVASEYYNLLRSLGCTSLTIDHITKVGMANENSVEAPYGSIVKYNRSRSQFELRLPDEADNNDHKEYAMLHRKFNLGRKLKPMGIAVDFVNNANELESISFKACRIEDSPMLSKSLTIRERLINELKRCGKGKIKDLAEMIGEPDKVDSVGVTLARYKKDFIKLGDGVYGLLQQS